MVERARRVIWSDGARAALEDILAYAAKAAPDAVLNLLEGVLARAESSSLFTERGRIVPELGQDDILDVFVYRYRILYEVHETEVVIIGMLHGARDFDRWKREDD